MSPTPSDRPLPRLCVLHGVGLGPGAPDLLTLRAARVLASVPVVFAPAARRGASVAARIMAAHALAERIRLLPFALDRDQAALEHAWRANADIILDHLRAGEDAAFACEGDPLLYSTFVHTWAALRALEPETTVRVVPGVSSVMAAAARAGLPLVDGDERLTIAPATAPAHELAAALSAATTVVFLKVSANWSALWDVLAAHALLDQAVLVERVGWDDERVVHGLAGLREARPDYFALVLARRGRSLLAPAP